MSSSDDFEGNKKEQTPLISNIKQTSDSRRQKIGLDVELTAPAFSLVYIYKNNTLYIYIYIYHLDLKINKK